MLLHLLRHLYCSTNYVVFSPHRWFFSCIFTNNFTALCYAMPAQYMPWPWHYCELSMVTAVTHFFTEFLLLKRETPFWNFKHTTSNGAAAPPPPMLRGVGQSCLLGAMMHDRSRDWSLLLSLKRQVKKTARTLIKLGLKWWAEWWGEGTME